MKKATKKDTAKRIIQLPQGKIPPAPRQKDYAQATNYAQIQADYGDNRHTVLNLMHEIRHGLVDPETARNLLKGVDGMNKMAANVVQDKHAENKDLKVAERLASAEREVTKFKGSHVGLVLATREALRTNSIAPVQQLTRKSA